MKNNTTEKAVLAKVFDLMNDWILESQNPDTPVIDYHRPEELQNILSLNIAADGADIEEVLDEVHKYLKYAVKTSHPAYLN